MITNKINYNWCESDKEKGYLALELYGFILLNAFGSPVEVCEEYNYMRDFL